MSSDSASSYDDDNPRAWRARRRQELRARNPYPWPYFQLPLVSDYDPRQFGHEPLESDSEDERLRRDRIILRPEPTRQVENNKAPVEHSQTAEHLDAERANPSIAPHTCAHCAKLRIDLRRHIETAEMGLTISKVKAGAEDGCPFLSSLLREIYEYVEDETELGDDPITTSFSASVGHFHTRMVGDIGVFDAYEIPGLLNNIINRLYVSLTSTAGQASCNELVHRGLPPNLAPNSALSFNRLRSWLDECQQSHPKCKAFRTEYMPRRVLEIKEGPKQPTVRLCTDPPSALYVTLSYCWGGDQHSKTLKTRLGQYEQGILFDTLPKTIQDAVIVTLGIGLTYLWVDAICIVQDDTEDKLEQISQMHLVYRGAYFTIAAANSPTSYDGFLQPRVRYRPTRVPARMDDNVFTEVLLSPEYSGLVTSDHLFLRGWTFQETHLSTRIAVYGPREMVFCCLEGVRSDGGTATQIRTRTSAFSGAIDPGNQVFGSLQHPNGWASIIEQYSGRNLTDETDKLPGIAALAEEYAQTKPVTEYFAGMWREDFLLQCLWTVSPFRARRPSVYTAPSWSWASVIGSIGHPRASLANSGSMEIACTLLDVQTTLASSHRFGAVTGGRMKVRARVRGLAWWKLDTDRLGGVRYGRAAPLTAFQFSSSPAEDPQIRCNVDIPGEWPTNEFIPMVGMEVCTVKENTDRIRAFGLLLGRVGAHSYRRVGWMTVYDMEGRDYWFDEDLGLAMWEDVVIT
ncbi:heterokaryon incompatibility protein-domain-containing protein [Hypoxylon cercidicola]|nr:heterokaryon incompatibility protein-domain-containing protein [Hypoxylon cercidicola]